MQSNYIFEWEKQLCRDGERQIQDNRAGVTEGDALCRVGRSEGRKQGQEEKQTEALQVQMNGAQGRRTKGRSKGGRGRKGHM